MYCRNCGNEVNDKAIACPKCGVNPKKEKNFCPNCGVATNANQVMCISCGASLGGSSLSLDTSKLQVPNIDTGKLLANKSLIFALIGIISFFMTWITESGGMMGNYGSKGLSGSSLSDLTGDSHIKTILIPMLVYLFPLALIGVIAAVFVPQIAKYQKMLAIGAIVLAVYAGIGIFTTKIDFGELNGMVSMLGAARPSVSFSPGFGYYVALVSAAVTVYFINKK